MNDAGVLTLRAGGGDFGFMTTHVAAEEIAIGMEDHREIAFRTECLPTAFFTDSKRGRTTTIMKKESMMVILKIFCDTCQ